MMIEEFVTPPNHIHFLAKKLFGSLGEIIDGSIAYIEPNGGGPIELHTHDHSHLFIVSEGQIKIWMDKEYKILNKDESILVDGRTPHSVWNNIDSKTTVIGISIKQK